MNNKLIFLFVMFMSLFITSAISAFLGLAFYLLNLGFWSGFILAFSLQTVVFGLYSKIKDKQTLIEFQKIELAKKIKQVIQLTCSHCKKLVIVPISLNEENRFVCPECKESNLVIIQYTVAQVTTPKIAKIDIEIPKGVDLPENINIDETVKNFLLDNSKQNLKSNNKDKNKDKGNNEHN